MYLRLGKVKLHVSFLFSAFLAFLIGREDHAGLGAMFVSALLHELGHLVFLLSFGCEALTLRLYPGGAQITGRGIEDLSYRRTLVCVLAGPLVNLLLFFALSVAAVFLNTPALHFAAGINLKLALFNLLPLSFLDGGRALTAVFMMTGNDLFFIEHKRSVDRITLALLAGFTVVLFLAGGDALFFAVFTAYCVLKICGK